jgi:hypothetical protein
VVAWVIKRYRVLVVTDISEHSTAPVIMFSTRILKVAGSLEIIHNPMPSSRYYGIVGAFKILNRTRAVRKIFNVNQQVEGKWKGKMK